jgi:uncharacterized protein (DUF983 family)
MKPSEADNGCPRCGRELCMEHGLFADSRCAVCEDDFTQRHLRAKLTASAAALVLFASLLGVLSGTGLLWKILAIPFSGWGLALAAFTLVTIAMWTARTVVRRKFLRERRAPAPLVHARA